MKIDIPDKLIRKLLLDQIAPSFLTPIDENKIEIKKLIVKEIMKQYKNIKWPKINNEEIKKAVLEKIAESAVKDYLDKAQE